MDERDWSHDGFKIKYWKPITPDPRGRKPFLKTDRNGYFKVFMKKVFMKKVVYEN